jgi:antitoxin MazE
MPTQTRAQRWGGSVTAPIPAAIARRLRITPGTPIVVEERDGGVLVKPAARPRRSLSEILRSCRKKFPKGNPHGAIDFGPPVGKELW